ncbi:MAG: 5'-nucleotidase C-terminal domain-containing protein [Spirochaetaceae bacterium]|jgi:hypothetical protein|nr:5'-nucleotidase C-terminal domain-containing protein [Spirochaetaceae bacterium]
MNSFRKKTFYRVLCVCVALVAAGCDDIPEPEPVDPEFGTNRFDSRKRETALGDMICDGIVWDFNEKSPPGGRKADFGVLNGGIFEFGLPKGNIYPNMINGMLKGDALSYIDMKGAAVKKFFDELAAIPIGANAWAQVSKEVEFTINWTNGMGQVRGLKINGMEVDDDTDYRLVTGHVLIWGKPGSHIDRYYDTLHELETANQACAVKLEGRTVTGAVTAYAASRPQPYIPEIDGRIVIEVK